jgi:imidazolonepropionase-like amidohydrolase
MKKVVFVALGAALLASTPLAATMNAATLLGVDKEVGSLEPGKAADLIAVAGDPIADITTLKFVRFVMKDGRVFKAE